MAIDPIGLSLGAVIKGALSIGNFDDNFDTEAGRLTDPALQGELKTALATLKQAEDMG